MNFSQILCVPDLLRGVRSFPEGFFDLVREPILQGTGLHIGFPPESNRPHTLPADFNLGKFRELANVDMDSEQQQSQWSASYYRIPAPALDYLFKYIASDSLVFSFEIPPWLANACLDRGIHFIDMRPSPLRFGRDLYVALRCSEAQHLTRIAAHTVLDEEIRLEASMLAANVRMHQRRMVDDRGYAFNDLHNSLIFIGQAPYDASLLTPEGKSAHCTDYTQQLRQLCSGKRLLHKAHPFATDFSGQERAQLAAITGQPVTACPLNAYQILSSNDAFDLAGISSGLLQEASYFGKTAYTLFQPFVPLAEQPTTDDYQQIHFDTFLSPGFWHSVLTPEKAEPRLKKLPAIAHHHARETLDQWWDYSKVMTWERSLALESFERSGGIVLRKRIEALQQGLLPNRSMVGDGVHEEHSSDVLWANCLNSIRAKINDTPQEFGRGDLYQGHESWGISGQRPTLERIHTYELDKWLPAQASVLDIGCNIGMFGLALSPKIKSYYGFDDNPLLIDIAKQIANVRDVRNVRFECESFQDFAAQNKNDKFDTIFSFAVHVWISMSIAEYAKTTYDLLHPNGILIWESNRLDTNDKDFFQNVRYFMDAGFSILSSGKLKDDGIIERGFYVLSKQVLPQ